MATSTTLVDALANPGLDLEAHRNRIANEIASIPTWRATARDLVHWWPLWSAALAGALTEIDDGLVAGVDTYRRTYLKLIDRLAEAAWNAVERAKPPAGLPDYLLLTQIGAHFAAVRQSVHAIRQGFAWLGAASRESAVLPQMLDFSESATLVFVGLLRDPVELSALTRSECTDLLNSIARGARWR